MVEREGRGAAITALAGVAVVAAVVACSFWGFSYDDAYTTYRYASNFAAGNGLVFHPGERVQGTTAPGYAVLLGSLSWLTGLSPAAWGTVTGILGLLATAWAPWLLPSRCRPPVAWIGLWGVALLVSRWHFELLGAETMVAMGLFAVAGVLLLTSRAPLIAGFLAAAGASMRFDGVLVCGVLVVAAWAARRAFPWRFVLGLLPSAAVVVAVTTYYGSPLPHSLTVKQGEFPRRVSESYSVAEWLWLTRAFGGVGAWLLLGLALVGLLALWREGRLGGPLLLAAFGWVGVYELFYRLVEVPFSPWYHVAAVALLLGLAIWGALWGSRWLLGRTLRSEEGRVLRSGASALALAILLAATWSSLQFGIRQAGSAPDPRWSAYHRAARILRELAPDGKVAIVEVGITSYYAPDVSFLDLSGLVSPEVASLGPERAFERAEPSVVVDATRFHRHHRYLAALGTAADPRWRVVAELEQPTGRGGVVRILERVAGR